MMTCLKVSKSQIKKIFFQNGLFVKKLLPVDPCPKNFNTEVMLQEINSSLSTSSNSPKNLVKSQEDSNDSTESFRGISNTPTTSTSTSWQCNAGLENTCNIKNNTAKNIFFFWFILSLLKGTRIW